MFEKYWKPYFDTWTQGTGERIEQYLRMPSTLEGISKILHAYFKGKQAADKMLYMLLTSTGLSSYRDQKRILHLVQRLAAQVEDAEDRLSDRLEELQEQMEQLQLVLQTLEDQNQKLHTLQTQMDSWTEEAPEEADALEDEEEDWTQEFIQQITSNVSQQFAELHTKIDRLEHVKQSSKPSPKTTKKARGRTASTK